MSKSRLLLLDAMIVIKAHEMGLWPHLVAQFQFSLPSIVAYNEAKYFESRKGRQSIQLKPLIESGEIIVLEADQPEVDALRARFKPAFLDRIHVGEQEALALITSGKYPDHKFCTSDGSAISALAMLYLSDNGISFEKVLAQCGRNDRLERQFTEAFFRKQLQEGLRERALYCL